jgi:hypothetical protein
MKAKQYFEEVRAMLPYGVDSRSDRNKVLAVAIDYIRELQGAAPVSRRKMSLTHDEAECDLMFEMEDSPHQKLRWGLC